MNIDRLRTTLRYDSSDGEFYRLQRTSNSTTVGERAGCVQQDGYLCLRVFGKLFLAHRLAWFYVHGEWPTGEIDHIDGDRRNNRMSNLRDVPRTLNAQNLKRAKSSNKSSGILGVYRHGSGWRSRITSGGTSKCLGTFRTQSEAHQAYLVAKRELHAGNTL